MLASGSLEGNSNKLRGLLLVSVWPFRRHIGYFYTAKPRVSSSKRRLESSMNSSTNESYVFSLYKSKYVCLELYTVKKWNMGEPVPLSHRYMQ